MALDNSLNLRYPDNRDVVRANVAAGSEGASTARHHPYQLNKQNKPWVGCEGYQPKTGLKTRININLANIYPRSSFPSSTGDCA